MKLSEAFICAGNPPADFETATPAPYFRKSFVLDFVPQRAELVICGLGFYQLYCNGKDITKGALAPYISNPDDIIYYDRYDVTEHLCRGENVIGVVLGNGFLNPFGGAIWEFEKAAWRTEPQLALWFSAAGEGGSLEFEADDGFLVQNSPILFDELRMGTHYDARLERPGWNLPGYDASGWRPAVTARRTRGEARLCTAEPVKVYDTLAPQSIRRCGDFCYCTENGEEHGRGVPVTYVKDAYLYDFGVNTAGVCRLKIRGEKGQKIILRHGEHLSDGKFSMNTVDFHREDFPYYYTHAQTDVYICKGGEEEIFVPPFTYHGFRYVLAEGLTEAQATDDALTYLVMSSDLPSRCKFSCSSEMVNRIWECTMVSDRANFYYFPNDCPHREKNGWTADAALSAEQMLLHFGAGNSLSVWLDNIRKAQRQDGALPGIIPTSGWGFAWGNGPAWDSVIAYLPYYIYKYDGKTSVITDNAQAIVRYLRYLTTRMDADGLLSIGLGDWLQPGRPPEEPDAPLRVTDSAMALDIAQKAAFLFQQTGMDEQYREAHTFAQSLRAAFRRHLIDFDTMTVAGNCQTSQTLAIAFDIFEPEEKPNAVQRLIELVNRAGGVLATGVIGGRYLFHVLAEAGYTETAYRMITQEQWPSYGNWMVRGATSLWENFYGETESPASLNHHFWGDVSSWFVRYLSGLRYNPEGSDTARADISPCFDLPLSWAEAQYTSVHGAIKVRWERVQDGVCLTLDMAELLHGTITLPDGWQFAGGGTTGTAASGVYEIKRLSI